MDSSIIAAIIGAVATIIAVFIGWLLQKSSREIPQNIQTKIDNKPSNTETEAKKFAQRYLDYPSHYRFVKALPKLKTVVLENAQQGWDSGVTADMRQASYDVIDFLEYSWISLARFCPSDYWGGKDAETYIRNFIQDRFTFHWFRHEPEGKGVGGTIVGVVTGGDVINDLENLIEETVSALFKGKDDFDLTTWLAEWKREL
jgi:hypothetical protein